MMRTKMCLIGAAVLGVSAGAAMASDQPGAAADQWLQEASATLTSWAAGDAGQYPVDANLTRGDGPLNRITGSLVQTPDVDMYCIRINDPQSFSATAVANATFGNVWLGLFNTDGTGVTFNDNLPDGNPTPGTNNNPLITGVNVPVPGLYFLAIGRSDGSRYFRPLDANGNLMFAGPAQGDLIGGPGTERNLEFGPMNPAAVLTSYELPAQGFPLFNYNYNIILTGAGYHQLPAPGAATLLGLGGLIAVRRRR